VHEVTSAAGVASEIEPGLKYRRITVVVDPTAHEQPALAKAVAIAKCCGSKLELFICDVRQDMPESWAGGSRMTEYREMTRLRLLSDLKALAAPLLAQGLSVSTECEWHAPLEQGITHHAIRTLPDLLVKDAHHHVALPHATVTRTDWHLIRQVPVPLLLVRPTAWASAPRILAAVDPCRPADRPQALDQRIVDHSRALADAFGGSLNVCHVLQSPPHLPDDAVPYAQKAAAQVRDRSAVKELAWRVAAASRFAEGSAAQGLLRLAKEFKPDVLVMGAVARLRGAHAVPGGTAAQILEELDADLLVVKPPGFVSPLMIADE
jgi:universal stress protein E